MGWDAPIGAETGRELKLVDILRLGETLTVGRVVGITGDAYWLFNIFWVVGSPEGWGRLSEALGGVLGTNIVILVAGGHWFDPVNELWA